MGARPFQTNFTGGALAPQLRARSDYKRYANGARKLKNVVVRVQGGVTRRAGSMYVASAKGRSAFQASAFQFSAFQVAPSVTINLIPFVFDTNDAVMIEVGAGYFRFYKDRAVIYGTGTGSEILSNPTFDSDIASWTTSTTGAGSAAWQTGGYARLSTGGAGTATMYQAAVVAPATKYVVEFRVGGDEVRFKIGSTLGAADLLAEATYSAGTYRAIFDATGVAAYIQFEVSSGASTVDIDYASLKEAAPLEVSNPYTVDDVRYLRPTQSGDVMYFAHYNHQPMKLSRLSDTVWTFAPTGMEPFPTDEVDFSLSATVTPGATTGLGITFTSDADVFLAADVNRRIKSQGGIALITAVNTANTLTVDIVSSYIDTAPIPPDLWFLDGSPSTALTLAATGPVNASVAVTAADDAFRSSDVGGYIYGLGGVGRIVDVASATGATIQVMRTYSNTALSAGAWTLEFPEWSDTLGWPGVAALHEQRLWFASTSRKPSGLWGSVSGDYENFTRGSADDDAVHFVIPSSTVETIRWIKPLRHMMIGAIATEHKLTGGTDKAITPTSAVRTEESAYGSDPQPDAIRAGGSIVFIQRGRRQLRRMQYSFEADAFQANDIALIASHLFNSGAIAIAACQSPDPYIFVVMEDGTMAVCAHERLEDVTAWSHFETDGKYVAVAVMPSKCGTGDEVWVAVTREINGYDRTFIEVFDGQLNTDAALVLEDPNRGYDYALVTGMSHLEGKAVDVISASRRTFQHSAFQMSAFQKPTRSYFTSTVVSGSVDASADPGWRLEVGLHYDSEIVTMPLENPTSQGTSQFRRKRDASIYVRFHCARGGGILVNGEAVDETRLAELTDEDQVADWIRAAKLGWDRSATVTVKQTHPYPMTVLGIGRAGEIDDGDAP